MPYRHHRPGSRSKSRKHFFWIVVAILAAVVIVVAILFPLVRSLLADFRPKPPVTYQAPPPPPPPDWSGYFASTTLQAKAAYVVDLSNGQVLFSKNASEPLALASLTKLMTTATALDTVPTTTIVAVTRLALAEDGDNGLYADERWHLDDLLRFTLVVSSNDGATAVAENVGALLENPQAATTQTHLDASAGSSTVPLTAPNAAVLVWSTSTAALGNDQAAFVQKMNQPAGTLGLSSASFFNADGLDLNTASAGAYGSAEDVAKLITYVSAQYPDITNATRYATINVTSLSNLKHSGKNTDILSLQGLDLIASKTGYTDLAGGNLAIITNIGGHPIVIVALGSTYDSRFSDVAALASSSAAVVAAGG